MKKVTIFLSVFMIVNSVFAQEKPSKEKPKHKEIITTVFKLNLGEPTKDALSCEDATIKRLVLRSRNLLAFKLENGNPYKYRYVINSRVVNFFEDVKFNYLDSVGKKIQIPKTGLQGSAESKMRGDSLKQKLNDLDVQINQKGFDKSKTMNLYAERSKIIAEIQKLSYSYNAQQIILDNKFLANSLLIKSVIPANEEEEKIIIKNALLILTQKLKNQKTELGKHVASISTEDFLDKKEFSDKRKVFVTEVEKLGNDLSKLNSDAMHFDDIRKDYTKNLNEFNVIFLDVKQEITKMFQLKLYNYQVPIDINGKNIDLVEVTAERYDKTATNPTPDKYTYNIYVRGGLKIDISGGLFITSLFDKEYETKDVAVIVNGTNETQKLIYEKNKGNYDFGFGSMLNSSLRGGSWVRPSLSIGALFTANQKFQILSGLGLILGKEERIILHAGLSMGTVSEISNQFKTDGSTSYNLGTSGQVPTSDKFKFGHFFGLTYNLGKTKTQTKPN